MSLRDVPPLEFVTERPIDEKPSGMARCPYCGSGRDRLTYHGATQTLLGGGDGTRDGDPNHWHEDYTCEDCHKPFQRETRSGRVWYTDSRENGLVLVGFPNCYESYTYHHAGCGRLVNRRYTNLDGTSEVQCLTWTSDHGKMFRTFFDCECGASVEV